MGEKVIEECQLMILLERNLTIKLQELGKYLKEDLSKNIKDININKNNIKGFHFLTVENQRFKNMQQANPFLMNRKKKPDPSWSDLDIISLSNADYFQQLYQSTEHKKRTIDINNLLTELDNPIFS